MLIKLTYQVPPKCDSVPYMDIFVNIFFCTFMRDSGHFQNPGCKLISFRQKRKRRERSKVNFIFLYCFLYTIGTWKEKSSGIAE